MSAPDRDPSALPTGLRERVLAASLHARAMGRPVPDAPEISAAEAYDRAAAAFDALLSGLADDDWAIPVLRDLDVQGLVGHLIGVEADVQRALAGDPDVADASHVESTQAAAVGQGGRPPAATRADWRRASARTLDLVRSADPEAKVAVHGMRLSLAALLAVRAFELWVHDNDVREAVAAPPAIPDDSTLRLMTDLGARLLPQAADRAGLADPVQLRLVLTGSGGGTWDLRMGPGQDAPACVSIVADAVGFCRLVANRIAPDDLDLHTTGDPAHVTAVLEAACTLALD